GYNSKVLPIYQMLCGGGIPEHDRRSGPPSVRFGHHREVIGMKAVEPADIEQVIGSVEFRLRRLEDGVRLLGRALASGFDHRDQSPVVGEKPSIFTGNARLPSGCDVLDEAVEVVLDDVGV